MKQKQTKKEIAEYLDKAYQCIIDSSNYSEEEIKELKLREAVKKLKGESSHCAERSAYRKKINAFYWENLSNKKVDDIVDLLEAYKNKDIVFDFDSESGCVYLVKYEYEDDDTYIKELMYTIKKFAKKIETINDNKNKIKYIDKEIKELQKEKEQLIDENKHM